MACLWWSNGRCGRGKYLVDNCGVRFMVHSNKFLFEPDNTYVFMVILCLIVGLSLLMWYLRFLFLKTLLIRRIKRHHSDSFGEVACCNSAFIKFIKAPAETGDNDLDVLRFKAMLARRYMWGSFVGMMVCFLVLVVTVFIKCLWLGNP